MKTRSYYGVLALISALAIAVRIIAIPYFGNGLNGNPVDIYYVDREAAQLILELKDPYLYSNYTNQIGGVVTFAYLPLIPIYYAPFVLIGADIRYGNILADLIITVALYFIGRSTSRTTSPRSLLPLSGSLAYAVLPTSIWLSAVVGSNMMIGSMFLAVALAFLMEGRNDSSHYLLSSIFLALALATDQFMVLVFPVVALYFFRNRQLKPALIAILVSGAIVLPFFLYSPSNFAYDVLLFQFERPLQSNGLFSLYGVLYATTGFRIGTLYRLVIFLVPAAISTSLLSRTKTGVLIGIAAVSSLGAFLLPVDGFWNYFLLPMTMICALVPAVLTRGSISEQTSTLLSETAEEEDARRLPTTRAASQESVGKQKIRIGGSSGPRSDRAGADRYAPPNVSSADPRITRSGAREIGSLPPRRGAKLSGLLAAACYDAFPRVPEGGPKGLNKGEICIGTVKVSSDN